MSESPNFDAAILAELGKRSLDTATLRHVLKRDLAYDGPMWRLRQILRRLEADKKVRATRAGTRGPIWWHVLPQA